MAIGWLTILKTVPWAEVISNAPKVADGAKKLWQTVGKKTAAHPVANTETPANDESTEAPSLATLSAQVKAVEVQISEFQGQMLTSSDLIRSLAEQNAELVKRLETIRIRALWLTAATLVLAIIALTGLARTIVMP